MCPIDTYLNALGSNSETIEQLMDYTEKYIMTKLYKDIFMPLSSEDEEKDLAIQNRIRSLNWISAEHLETGINDKHPEARDLIDKAITGTSILLFLYFDRPSTYCSLDLF